MTKQSLFDTIWPTDMNNSATPLSTEQPALPKNMDHCPVCSTSYHLSAIFLIENRKESRLFHATCSECAHAMMALVVDSQVGTSSVGMITELSATELVNVRSKEALSDNDLLSFSAALRNNEKDFLYLMTQ